MVWEPFRCDDHRAAVSTWLQTISSHACFRLDITITSYCNLGVEIILNWHASCTRVQIEMDTSKIVVYCVYGNVVVLYYYTIIFPSAECLLTVSWGDSYIELIRVKLTYGFHHYYYLVTPLFTKKIKHSDYHSVYRVILLYCFLYYVPEWTVYYLSFFK